MTPVYRQGARSPTRDSHQYDPALEVEIRRHGRKRRRSTETTRGRECADASDYREAHTQSRRDGRLDPKKRMGPSQRQEAVKALQRSGLSQRQACAIMRARRRPSKEQLGMKATQDAPLVVRLTQLAQEHPRYGCKRLYVIYERQARDVDPYMN